MAWQAAVTGVVVVVERDVLILTARYYDDLNSGVTLGTYQREWPLATPIATMRVDLQTRGQTLRDATARAATLPNYVGTVVPVP